ncbi:MAG: hypothetical protein RLY31_2874 [Bacteroidota bacterium]|jgi:hypothetical protein
MTGRNGSETLLPMIPAGADLGLIAETVGGFAKTNLSGRMHNHLGGYHTGVWYPPVWLRMHV